MRLDVRLYQGQQTAMKQIHVDIIYILLRVYSTTAGHTTRQDVDGQLVSDPRV